jgi:hypothetical protein
MATLYISEYVRTGLTTRALVLAGEEPSIASQTVSIGASSAQSSALNAETRFVRVSTDATCSIAFGANPTATTASMRLPANSTEYFAVMPGMKIAVISNT